MRPGRITSVTIETPPIRWTTATTWSARAIVRSSIAIRTTFVGSMMPASTRSTYFTRCVEPEIAFSFEPGGRGTADMMRRATNADVEVWQPGLEATPEAAKR